MLQESVWRVKTAIFRRAKIDGEAWRASIQSADGVTAKNIDLADNVQSCLNELAGSVFGSAARVQVVVLSQFD